MSMLLMAFSSKSCITMSINIGDNEDLRYAEYLFVYNVIKDEEDRI